MDSTRNTSSAAIAAKSVVAATSAATKNDRRKARHDSPQKSLGDFWTAFQSRKPGKITSVFPRRLYDQLGLHRPADVLWPVTVSSSGVSTPSTTNSWAAIGPSTPTDEQPPTEVAPTPISSYERAAAACRAAVARIVDECHRTNAKFTDPEFNLEQDPKLNCLRGLVRRKRCDGGEDMALMPEHTPQAVHRVDWIFEKPVFVKTRTQSERSERRGGDTNKEVDIERSEDHNSEDRRWDASSVQQGKLGDCWWIAAVATIAHRSDLMDRICVARDEMCGVYGFVFVRDGQWTHVVVDDNLYLHHEDFEYKKLDSSGQKARDHRQRFQRGSEALSFAHCTDANETWLPLMEKAYAKAMGDYGALSGGWHSEGMEDLTGGVSTTVVSSRVMDRGKLWEELAGSKDNGENERQRGTESERQRGQNDFVFGLSVMGCGCYLANHNGLAVNHCYSVLRAVEATTEDGKDTLRLVKVRNPWGHRSEHTHMGAWHGPWSNGAKEWTPYWLKTLDHTFGDDGVFWMTYEDLLDTFGYIHRTRLFDESWTIIQRWTSLAVGWVAAYSGTHFVVDVKRPGLVVIVLSQLDSRYFRGLRGQYDFTMHFVLTSSDGSVLSTVHTHNENESRSISCEVNLPVAGRYVVRPSVKAKRDRKRLTEAAVVRLSVESNPDKLRQIGQQYDLAHAKGVDVVDEDTRLEQKRAKRLRQLKARRDWQRAESKRYKAAVEAWVNLIEKKRQRQKEVDDKDDRKDGKDNKDVDPGPEPKPLPEPDFFSDDDESDDDLLDDDEGDDAVAEIRKVINKKGWPFDGDKCCDDKKERDEKDKKKDVEDDSEEPWNAVCVVGLRVFAKDPEVAIDLVKGER